MLVDARNGFNKLSRLAMLRAVRHFWPTTPRELPVTILSREGVTQGDSLSMVLYGITLAPLAEELRAADPGLLPPFYADDAAFDGSEQRRTQLLKLLMRRGLNQGYFPEPAKSLFISEILGQESEAKRRFAAEELTLDFVSGSQYLGE